MPANEHSRKENVLKSIHYYTSSHFLLFNIYSLNMCDLGLDVPIGRPQRFRNPQTCEK